MTTAREVELAVKVRDLLHGWMGDDDPTALLIEHPQPCAPCRHDERDHCERYGNGRSCLDAELLAIELSDVGPIAELVAELLGVHPMESQP